LGAYELSKKFSEYGRNGCYVLYVSSQKEYSEEYCVELNTHNFLLPDGKYFGLKNRYCEKIDFFVSCKYMRIVKSKYKKIRGGNKR